MILAVLREYGLLSEEETQEFMVQFGAFLAHSGISQENWDKMLKDDKATAERILHLFSLSVLDGIIGRVECLQIRTKSFSCFLKPELDGFQVISISSKGETSDLTTDDLFDVGNQEKLSSKRIYKSGKSADVLDLVTRGYIPCSAQLFDQLKE